MVTAHSQSMRQLSKSNFPRITMDADTEFGISAVDDPSTEATAALAENAMPADGSAGLINEECDSEQGKEKNSRDEYEYATVASVNELKDMLSNLSKMVSKSNEASNTGKSNSCCAVDYIQ
eukprot:IDg13326t1